MNFFNKMFDSNKDEPVTISLEPSKQEYFIDVTGCRQCRTMRGAFDIAIALINSINASYKAAYKIEETIPTNITIARAIASRLYFLEKTDDLDCDLSVLINFINSDYSQQLKFLRIGSPDAAISQ